jgi:predicted DsbA family dithiol-disulfide isomerase
MEEIVRIAEFVGLPADEAQRVLENRSFASAVDTDWQRSRDMGITAVPSHLFNGKLLAGFGSYEDFVRLIA